MIRALTLLAWIPFIWQPMWGQSPSVGVKKTVIKPPNGRSSSDPHKGTDERGSKERPIVVDTEGHHQSNAERAQSDAKEQRAREVERWTLYFAQLSAWATGALVLIGFGGVVAAILTLHKIANQAKLMERQATIMERQETLMQAPFEQWVDVMNWKIRKGVNPAFEPYDFECTADLVNKSTFPMTLTDGHIIIGDSVPFQVGGLFLSPTFPTSVRIDITSQRDKPVSFFVEWTFTHRHKITGSLVTHNHKARLTWVPQGAEGYWWDAQIVVFGRHDDNEQNESDG